MNTTYDHNTTGMRLYNDENQRLYLNAQERADFIKAAHTRPEHIRTFCLTLLYTGCRLSEARELTTQSLQAGEQRIAVRSLKKRDQHHIRVIPVPVLLVQSLCQYAARTEKPEHTSKSQNNTAVSAQTENIPIPNLTWLWASDTGDKVNRIVAYRWIKTVMKQANIHGPQACPKGLRHAYAIHAIKCGIQLNMVQKWMGHTDIATTAIYANAVGAEELEIAGRMW